MVEGNYLYTNAFPLWHEEGTISKRLDMALYRVDLLTMEHEQIHNGVATDPVNDDEWLYFRDLNASLYRIQKSSNEVEFVLRGMGTYYYVKDGIIFHTIGEDEATGFIWEERTIRSNGLQFRGSP